tara:strand:- start:1427 stop:1561 length:135 start_codon:yes stop_codon:yes gene_type:complete
MFRIMRDNRMLLETSSISILLEWLEKNGDDYDPKAIYISSNEYE